jgi:ubiquinone/menaquinone biosynthesis C-methylase UbiE
MSKINTPADFIEAVNAFRLSRVILTAFELDIFTVLGKGSMSSTDISSKIETDARATDRLMNVLAGCGLLEKKSGKFINTPFAEKFLVKGSSSYMGGTGHISHLWHSWTTMTDAVRKGTSVMMRSEINARGEDWLEPFIAAMHQRGIQQAKIIANLLDLSGVHKILDVGGGSGAFSFAIVDKNPAVKAIVYDLPNVVPITKKYIQNEGYENKVGTLTGNYLEDPLGSEYDMAFLSAVIHSNSTEENKLLFRKCAKALNPGGQLVVLDHIMSEDRTEPFGGAMFSLNMLVGTQAGDTYTESEIKSWMGEAGFEEISLVETEIGTNLLVGYLKS